MRRLWCCSSEASSVTATTSGVTGPTAATQQPTETTKTESAPEPLPAAEVPAPMSPEVASHALYAKFGSIFAWLVDALDCMSFDLIGVIASFLRPGSATPNAQPLFLYRFGTPGDFDSAYAIAEAPDREHMWLANQNRILIIDKQGTIKKRVAHTMAEVHQIAFDSNGEAFVADWTINCVYVFSAASAEYLRSIDDLASPGGVAVDRKGLVAVAGSTYVSVLFVQVCAEANGHRVRVFRRNGESVRWMGGWGNEQSQMRFPRELAINHWHNNNKNTGAVDIDGKTELFIADEDNEAVKVRSCFCEMLCCSFLCIVRCSISTTVHFYARSNVGFDPTGCVSIIRQTFWSPTRQNTP